MEHSFADDEGYDGPAVVTVADTEIPVEVRVRGNFQPIDGAFHWWARIQPSADLDASAKPGDGATLTTPDGSAAGTLSDVDPWGRFRLAGTGAPPFDVPEGLALAFT